MTEEEALAYIHEWLKDEYALNSKDREALDMAIKALEQQPCEDAISRQAVLALAKEECETAIIPYKRFVKGVNALTPVTPKPKTGHCEDCKCFRKLPYHTDTLGECIQHSRFYPKGDWYCADYEPQESEE